MKKRAFIVDAISAILLLLLLYAAVSKMLDHERFQQSLQMSPFLEKKSEVIAWVLPASEIIIAVLLFIPHFRLKGLYASFGLLTIFTIYLIYMVALAPHLPCNCGGILKMLTWKAHIFFNIFFMILSLIAIYLNRKSNVAIRMTPT